MSDSDLEQTIRSMNLGKYKILIADDHLLMRQMLVKILTEAGFADISSAANGALCLEKINEARAQENPYHVLFLDLAMPVMDGYQVLASCRADRRLDSLAIIILSAESDEPNIVRALEAGATAYVPKPFKANDLLAKLKSVLQWRDSQENRGQAG